MPSERLVRYQHSCNVLLSFIIFYVGILRCAAFSGAKGIVLHQQSTNQDTSSAIGHFHGNADIICEQSITHTNVLSIEKLFHLSGMMRTPMAQMMAEQRTKFMQEFVRQVELESSLQA